VGGKGRVGAGGRNDPSIVCTYELKKTVVFVVSCSLNKKEALCFLNLCR
jgi:hypothetical protein